EHNQPLAPGDQVGASPRTSVMGTSFHLCLAAVETCPATWRNNSSTAERSLAVNSFLSASASPVKNFASASATPSGTRKHISPRTVPAAVTVKYVSASAAGGTSSPVRCWRFQPETAPMQSAP